MIEIMAIDDDKGILPCGIGAEVTLWLKMEAE